jgi:hypothetical protein
MCSSFDSDFHCNMQLYAAFLTGILRYRAFLTEALSSGRLCRPVFSGAAGRLPDSAFILLQIRPAKTYSI